MAIVYSAIVLGAPLNVGREHHQGQCQCANVHCRGRAGVLRPDDRRGLTVHGHLARRRRWAPRSERDRHTRDKSFAGRLHGGVWPWYYYLPNPLGEVESLHTAGTCRGAQLLSPHSEIVFGIKMSMRALSRATSSSYSCARQRPSGVGSDQGADSARLLG